jgi:hypothetical protein
VQKCRGYMCEGYMSMPKVYFINKVFVVPRNTCADVRKAT